MAFPSWCITYFVAVLAAAECQPWRSTAFFYCRVCWPLSSSAVHPEITEVRVWRALYQLEMSVNSSQGSVGPAGDVAFSLDAFGFGIVGLGLQKANPFTMLETRISFSFRELVWWCSFYESHRVVEGYLLTRFYKYSKIV